MNVILKYIVFLLIVLVSGCSFTKSHVQITPDNNLPEIRKPDSLIVSNEDLSLSDNASLFIYDDEVINENGCDTVDGNCVEKNQRKTDEVPVEAILEDDKEINEIEVVDEIENKEKEQNLLDTALDFCNTSQEYWSEGKLEKALSFLDQAYALVLKVDTDKYPELFQQKEDLRFLISKRILEIYASRYTAVNGNHNEIPLVMNEYVQREIKLFQGPERKFFLASYKRSGKYMDRIKESLKEAGLPEDLAWLPLIESGFKVRALSRARALGLWQFIPSTGYKFGLKRDRWIDERLDPEKATAAAIAYMKELHQIFGDWTTVLAGYNCGESRVLRKIRDQKINYLDDFWDLFQRLPRETARYVPRYLATLHILKDPAKYGITLPEPDEALDYEIVTIEKQVQIKVVAKNIGVPLKELSGLNAELRQQVTPATPYSLKVPYGKSEALLAKLDEMPTWTAPENAYVYHRVKRGETLSLIAKRYRTSVIKIVRANNIRRKHLIRVGQKLKIPLRGSSSKKIYAAKTKLLPGGEYNVRKGDSLWLIARKFKTNTKSLKRLNNLRSTRLYVGQVIRVK